MNVRDGYAIKRAVQAGFQFAVISGGRSVGTKKRFELFGVNEIHLGIEHKLEVMEQILSKWNLSFAQIAYMGDDITDREILLRSGISACPVDAVPDILSICTYISPLAGGKACVRDLIEKIMQAQDLW